MSLSQRIIGDFNSLEASEWAGLDHADNPFLSYEFLSALEATGSIGPHAGWQPHHLAVYEDGLLAGFAPSYIKHNSHGEFVFDWAWADAYQRNGLAYYPKLLTGIPYSPVTGPRLLVRKGHPQPAAVRSALIQQACSLCAGGQFSSWHCNFGNPDDAAALAAQGLLERKDWQFHWSNNGYSDFDDFLADLRSRKRKNIRRERRQVRDAGIEVAWKGGSQLSASELDFIYECYTDTFHNYGNYPALQKSFFELLASSLGDGLQSAIASIDGRPVAMSVFLAGGGRLYGRYWGCVENIPALHFELAYYQGIEYCIQHGLDVFESGAQGEHKIGRGFAPSRTCSYHHIEHPVFRAAIAEHLQREERWLDSYGQQLDNRVPFRRDQR